MSVKRRPVMTNLISQSPLRTGHSPAWIYERGNSGPTLAKDSSTQKQDLSGEVIAILAADGVDQLELIKSREILEKAGASVNVVSPEGGHITSWETRNWGSKIDVDIDPDIATIERYAGLVLPGGLINADLLRSNPLAVEFVKAFFESNKPVAAIGHAPWLLIKADVLNGRMLTSSPSLETDICNAGGKWLDQAVVDDKILITGRGHSDLHMFLDAMISGFCKWHGDRVKIGPLDV